MSGQINMIGVSLPNRIKQINWRLYTCDYDVMRLVAIKLGVGWGVWRGGAPGFTKIVHNIYVFATGNLVALPGGP